jgi:hypothetical protein
VEPAQFQQELQDKSGLLNSDTNAATSAPRFTFRYNQSQPTLQALEANANTAGSHSDPVNRLSHRTAFAPAHRKALPSRKPNNHPFPGKSSQTAEQYLQRSDRSANCVRAKHSAAAREPAAAKTQHSAAECSSPSQENTCAAHSRHRHQSTSAPERQTFHHVLSPVTHSKTQG